jgi:hypothetical protein
MGIKDGSSNILKKYHNQHCGHARCHDCYDCNAGDFRMQHCDGAIIFDLFVEADAFKYLEWIPRPGDTRPTLPCPLKGINGCNKMFLKKEHTAQHARVHNPVLPIPCPFQVCYKEFTREDDNDLQASFYNSRGDKLISYGTCPMFRRYSRIGLKCRGRPPARI